MEGRICAEAAHATTRMGMSRKDANELVKRVLPKYEDKISEAPIGKTISECYDMERVKPTQEYLGLYEKMKKDVSSLGLDYSTLQRGKR
jgi:methylamine--corrinoid protein Co-methyltransferase